MDKKAMFEGSKSLLNLLIGFSLVFLGGFQLLIEIGVLTVGFPQIPKLILEIFLGVAGFYLIIDGILVITMHPMLTFADMVLGLSVASLGMVPLMNDLFGILFTLSFVNIIIIDVCFILAGFLMVFNSWNF